MICSIKKLASLAITASLLLSCTNSSYHLAQVDNPPFYPNTVFQSYENLSFPKFKALKEKYQLDTLFHGETDEFKRILLLRNWIHEHIKIDDIGPYPGDGSCESILDNALKGAGYHCGHFMVVQNAIMNAYGYVTRCIGAGPGGADGKEYHHGIDEIWLNTYHKWFLSDAKYNHHFEKNVRLPEGQRIPLSALEVRDAYLKNKAADITLVKGAERIPVEYDEQYRENKEEFARTYAWIEWDKYNNRYTIFPEDSAELIMYGDAYFKSHTWIWDDKPHWAYNTKFMNLVADRHAIEWTPNTISSKVSIGGNKAIIHLTSNTPNFKTYQVKELPGGMWENIPDSVEIDLKREKYEMVFRAENLAGVTGPEHKIIITKYCCPNKNI